MNISQALPTEISASGDIARRLLSALGPAFQAPDHSHNAAEMLAFADAFADLYTDSAIAMDQAFADMASVLLSELEQLYGLTVRSDLSTTARRSRILAKIRAARAGTPQDILSAVSVYDPAATMSENTAVVAAASGQPEAVFVFAVTISVAVFSDSVKLAAIRDAIQQMKPAHTKGSATTNVLFRFDDPLSLLDRDVLGP